MESKVRVGDKIRAKGSTFTVKQILSYEDWGNDGGIYLEFVDTNNQYHYWKQDLDGGEVIRNEQIYHRPKR